MRRATLFSLPVEMEMKMLRSGEESRQRDGMKESTGKQGYGGGERFACISLEEMKSFYRYTQCCQQLHSEFWDAMFSHYLDELCTSSASAASFSCLMMITCGFQASVA